MKETLIKISLMFLPFGIAYSILVYWLSGATDIGFYYSGLQGGELERGHIFIDFHESIEQAFQQSAEISYSFSFGELLFVGLAVAFILFNLGSMLVVEYKKRLNKKGAKNEFREQLL